ncbi:MFS transporter [Streptomyces sulfonofaciens]|uniref:MFS transporter n=1 Tax=Streptomyces sulfonofaciens TaxID=68272 RepID=A0A919GJB3_9ACTN|nr:MFS transporter [Streptomyces sulfonofaciens]GHH85687.1 MFS transporter [Streptomyces sulfonofaciens]
MDARSTDAPTTPGRTRGPRIPDLLRQPGFRRYWTGQTVSGLGDQISALAIPLIGVTVLHADAAAMGFLGAAAWLPTLLLGLPAGQWADRRRRRRHVMLAADLARAAVLVTVPVAAALGLLTLWHLYAVSFTVGTLSVFFEVSNPHVFKALVPADRYVAGNALASGGRAMAKVVGPSVGGLLVQWLSAPLSLLADAATFLASAFSLARVAPVEPPPAPRTGRPFAAAGGFILRSAVIRPALAATATVNFFTFIGSTLFVLYATKALHLDPGLIGAVLGAGALGALLGATCATRLLARIGVGRGFALGCVVFAAPMLLVPAAGGPQRLVLGLLVCAQFTSGLGVIWIDISLATIFAVHVPDDLRSGVFGAYQAVNLGTRPLASLLGGTLATVAGLRPTLWVAAAGALTAWVWLLPSPLLRRHGLPEQAGAPARTKV